MSCKTSAYLPKKRYIGRKIYFRCLIKKKFPKIESIIEMTYLSRIYDTLTKLS